MICPHCGAQWHLPLNNGKLITECPFCKGDMRAPKQSLTTTEETLKEIMDRFGQSVFEDGQQLLDLFLELAPNLIEEKNVLRFFIECGGHINLMKLQKLSPDEQAIGSQEQLNSMMQQLAEVCNSFMKTIGVEIQTYVPDTPIMEYEYIDLGDDTVELTFCKNQVQEEIYFPKKIDGKKVVSIAGTIFGKSKGLDSGRNKVKLISIPEGVTSIGSGAFHGCKSLEKVLLPSGLIRIEENAFKSCKSLSNIELPESVINIGKGAFSGSNIRKINLPEGIEGIEEEVFKNCKGLENVILPNSIKFIGEEAFSGCKSLKCLEVPAKVECIRNRAFHSCKSLTKVVLPDGIKSLRYNAFTNCETLTTINLPDSISSIAGGAFSGCFVLSNVVLPCGLTVIEEDVFARCRALEHIKIPEKVTSIEDYAFYVIDGLHVTIPKNVTTIRNAFSYCENLTIHCYEGSYAHNYAKDNNFKFELL